MDCHVILQNFSKKIPKEKTSITTICKAETLRTIPIILIGTISGKMEVPGSSKKMIATQEEMVSAKVPLAYRDQCAHLLIPLNKCRHAEFFLPWKCEDERHVYEKCEYELVMERMLQMQKIREEEAQQKAQHQQPIPLIPKTANA